MFVASFQLTCSDSLVQEGCQVGNKLSVSEHKNRKKYFNKNSFY